MLNTNNAEIPVNALRTTPNGGVVPVLTGIVDSKGIKAPVSIGKTKKGGSAETLTGKIPCDATPDTGGGTKLDKKPKVA